jgi:hypothetical protein
MQPRRTSTHPSTHTTQMISVSSDVLTGTIDPYHGAEILALVPFDLGIDLLGHPPFAAAPARGGDLDEGAWTASYRGGWQLATPNAGAECIVNGARHGFHGRASVDLWSVLETRRDRAVITWAGHGVVLQRTLTVDGLSVRAELEWTAAGSRPAPLVVVEHVALGRALLDPEVEIHATANAQELSPAAPQRAGGSRWPQVRLLDGSIEEAGLLALEVSRGRLIALTGFADGVAEVRNPTRDLGLRFEWPAATLPAAWVWHEARHRGGIWNHGAEMLGFEPSSVTHARGLAEAVKTGEAIWARPGCHDGYCMTVTVTGAPTHTPHRRP